ncbi:hypothetical protein ACFVS2_25870 [Brevibacillus sp. NPDC058079]|uniref:RCC1 domain-containing protein n=1 Tax=Brevibacillus sp. NPDC058079 TaxID=3346330 RepID=UPI0036E3AAA8
MKMQNLKDVKNVLANSPKKLFGTMLLTSMILGGVWGNSTVEASALTQTKVYAYGVNSYALTPDGKAWSWGDGSSIGVAVGENVGKLLVPTLNKYSDSDIVKIAYGGTNRFTFALKADGTVWAVGTHTYIPTLQNTKYTPVQIPGLTNIKDIAVGQQHMLAVDGNGDVWAWGNNSSGLYGDGTSTTASSPVKLTTISKAKQVLITNDSTHVTGGTASYVLDTDGNVWGWGVNAKGEMGDGTTTYRTTPVKVKNVSNITEISAGAAHVLARKSDGTVWSWGKNFNGQIGNGSNFAISDNMPIQVPTISNVKAVSAAGEVSMVLKNDGTVWGWGSSKDGELGNGTTGYPQYVTSPVQAKNLSDVVSLSSGGGHSLAVKEDGTVWSWGGNGYGKLGINESAGIIVAEPVQVQFPVVDTTGPAITLTASITSPTNKDVVVTVNATDDGGVAVKKYASGNQTASYFASNGTVLSGTTFNVATNGIYTVYAKDKAGNETVQQITISNIDKELPVINLTPSTTELTNATMMVTFDVANEKEPYIRKYAEGNQSVSYFSSNGITIANHLPGFGLDKNGVYTAYVKDAAGNESVKTIEIKNIDMQAPEYRYSQEIKGEKAIFEFTIIDQMSGVDRVEITLLDKDNTTKLSKKAFEFNKDNIYRVEYENLIEQKYYFIIEAYDKAGNRLWVNGNFDVDLTPPDAPTMTASTNEPTNQDVEVTINYPSDSSKRYKIGDGEWKLYTRGQKSVIVRENTIIYAQSKDSSDNTSEIVSLSITNIDKISPDAPSLEVNGRVLKIQHGEDRESGAKGTIFNINSQGWIEYRTEVELPMGDVTVEAKTIDRAGNESAVTTKSFKISNPADDALKRAEEAVKKAEGSKDQKDVDNARDLVDKLPEGKDKEDLKDRLDEVQKQIDDKAVEEATKKVETAEKSKNQADVNDARDAVNKLPDGQVKDDLNKRLDEVQKQIDNNKAIEEATKKVVTAENSKKQSDVNTARDAVNKLPDGQVKDDLNKRLDEVQKHIDNSKAFEEATKKVVTAEFTKKQSDVDIARDAVNKLPDGQVKDNLNKRLDEVQKQIDAKLLEDATKKVVTAETTKRQSDVDRAWEAVNKLPEGQAKEDLKDRLIEVQKQIDNKALEEATKKVVIAETNKRQTDVNTARDAVSKLPNGQAKDDLNHRLDEVQKQIDNKAVEEATKKVVTAENTKKQTDIDKAWDGVNKLPESKAKEDLKGRLEAIKTDTGKDGIGDAIDKIKDPAVKSYLSGLLTAVERAEKYSIRTYIQTAWEKAKAVPDAVKNDPNYQVIYRNLYDRAEKMKNAFNDGLSDQELKKAIQKATDYVGYYERYKTSYYNTKAQEAIDALPEGDVRTKLQERLDAVKV